jgi:hypothetical protein
MEQSAPPPYLSNCADHICDPNSCPKQMNIDNIQYQKALEPPIPNQDEFTTKCVDMLTRALKEQFFIVDEQFEQEILQVETTYNQKLASLNAFFNEQRNSVNDRMLERKQRLRLLKMEQMDLFMFSFNKKTAEKNEEHVAGVWDSIMSYIQSRFLS